MCEAMWEPTVDKLCTICFLRMALCCHSGLCIRPFGPSPLGLGSSSCIRKYCQVLNLLNFWDVHDQLLLGAQGLDVPQARDLAVSILLVVLQEFRMVFQICISSVRRGSDEPERPQERLLLHDPVLFRNVHPLEKEGVLRADPCPKRPLPQSYAQLVLDASTANLH